MSKRSFIDSVEVKIQCSESWDEMTGNERVRFCSHCSKHVNNISEMTRKEAMRMVRASGGNLCIRYYQHPVTKRPLFADGLIQIVRRTPRLTAGVMAASLSLANASGAQESPKTQEPTTAPVAAFAGTPASRSQNKKPESAPGGGLRGTASGPEGTVVAGASVKLIREHGESLVRTSNADGYYEFDHVPPGRYSLDVSKTGFVATSVFDIEIYAGQTPVVDVKLEAARIVSCAGGCSVIEYSNRLSDAVSDDDTELARKLLERGDNPNGREDNYGKITPLFIAVENGNVEMVKLLIDFGAKVNARDEDKQTPLMYIENDATPELISILVKAGAKVNLADNEGNTPLIRAAGECDFEIVKALLDAGADIKAKNSEGRTALLEAAYHDDVDAVRALITAGSEVNAKDSDEKNAWDLADDEEVKALLVACGTIAHPKLDENGALAETTPTPSPTPPYKVWADPR